MLQPTVLKTPISSSFRPVILAKYIVGQRFWCYSHRFPWYAETGLHDSIPSCTRITGSMSLLLVAVTAETHARTEKLLYTGQLFCKAFFCFFTSVSLQPLVLHSKTNIKLAASGHMTFRMLHESAWPFAVWTLHHESCSFCFFSHKPHFLAYVSTYLRMHAF